MVQLLPSPASAEEARRFVTAQVLSLGRPELVEDVATVVTELVTNAVIHAGTPIELTVRSVGRGVRVEVADGSAVVPRWTPAALSATSGRGLILVDRMASTWGVEPTEGGKTIWAVVEQPTEWVEETSFEELLAHWSDDDRPAPRTAVTSEEVRVALTVAVEQMLDSRAHTEDLVRELQLLVVDESADTDEASAPVVQLAHELAAANRAFYDGRHQMLTQTLGAAQRGQADVTLDLRLHRGDEEGARRWLAALDEADALAARGGLLLPPFPPAMVRFRREYIADIIRSLQTA